MLKNRTVIRCQRCDDYRYNKKKNVEAYSWSIETSLAPDRRVRIDKAITPAETVAA